MQSKVNYATQSKIDYASAPMHATSSIPFDFDSISAYFSEFEYISIHSNRIVLLPSFQHSFVFIQFY